MNENVGAIASPLTISWLQTGISVLGCFAPETSHPFEKRNKLPSAAQQK
ncbi:MAG: hypothetical protein F6J93_36050 [Oscillatoria sp. SIO1A7]|nr:hypothetical protein [Oscillatoria sp. SIO1A7]